ncbi:MAG: hypothetical protein IKE94_01145 [Aeriscardovia sp.]|nr:hypothetical protein [Aeriscardovia sp.]
MPTIQTPLPNLKIVTGTRWFDNTELPVIYIASVGADGFLYFNDDKFWRCQEDGTNLQIYYPTKDIWIQTEMIAITQTPSSSSTTGNAGSGSGVSPDPSVEAAVQWMINKAENEYTYYAYPDMERNLKVNANQYDCSSFVITGFYFAGFDADAYATGSMKNGFEALGFQWIPAQSDGSIPASMCVRGDILLNIVNHTQVYIGNNQDVNCGNTPAQVIPHDDYCRLPGGGTTGWDGLLRYVPSVTTNS